MDSRPAGEREDETESTRVPVAIFPVTPQFVAEVGDVDLSQPLSPDDRDAIMAAFSKYVVLVFPEQRLTPAQHVELATLFGPIEVTINSYQDDVKKPRIDERIADVSNLDHDDRGLPANSRKRLSSLLYARSIAPIGGHTEFADLRAAWDALPEQTRRRIDGLVVEHSIFTSRGA